MDWQAFSVEKAPANLARRYSADCQWALGAMTGGFGDSVCRFVLCRLQPGSVTGMGLVKLISEGPVVHAPNASTYDYLNAALAALESWAFLFDGDRRCE